MTDQYFPAILDTAWQKLLKNPTAEQYWNFAHTALRPWEDQKITGEEMAHALLSVMDMDFAQDPDIQDFLSLLGPLELTKDWHEADQQEVQAIITTHQGNNLD